MATIPPGTDLSSIPLTHNPNGDPPNFVNPPTQAAIALAVGLPLAIISACFVSVRLIKLSTSLVQTTVRGNTSDCQILLMFPG